jgi:hypothetical protein
MKGSFTAEHIGSKIKLGRFDGGLQRRRGMIHPFKTLAAGGLAVVTLATVMVGPAAAGRDGDVAAGVAAGVLGGLAIGAIASQPPAYEPAPVYAAPPPAECWYERQPLYDRWGNFLRYRHVRVCQ